MIKQVITINIYSGAEGHKLKIEAAHRTLDKALSSPHKRVNAFVEIGAGNSLDFGIYIGHIKEMKNAKFYTLEERME